MKTVVVIVFYSGFNSFCCVGLEVFGRYKYHGVDNFTGQNKIIVSTDQIFHQEIVKLLLVKKEATDTSDAGASGEEATEIVINLIKPSVGENVAVILLTLSSMSLKPSEIKIKSSKTIID